MRGTIARPVSAADMATVTPYIRNLCRNYERNNPTVRGIVEGLCANVVGSGIALEPDTGNPDWDEKLRIEWNEYIRDCFMDGTGLYAGQTLAFRDVVVAGDALWRIIIDGERQGSGKIPLAVLPLEAEWLGDAGMSVIGQSDGFVGGVELDDYARPKAYNLTTPSGKVERVPAKYVLHIFEKRRALQIRGEPWFAPVLTTLKQEKDLVVAELEAAKNTAGFAAAITSNGGMPMDTDEKGSPTRDINVGSVVELMPGEDIKLLQNTRPSQQIAPFRAMLRGDIAAALRISRRWLDRDISQANYSSMRADMLDSERLLGPVREWFGHQTAGALYKKVLPYLSVRAGIPVPRDHYRLVPDGQPYVDPEKDAAAAVAAINGGLTSYEAEIGKRGGDYKQVWKKIAEEKAFAGELGLVFASPSKEKTLFGEKEDIKETVAAEAPAPKESAKPTQEDRSAELAQREQALLLRRLDALERPVPHPPAIVNVHPQVIVPEQRQEAPVVNVRNDVPSPVVHVAAPTVNVAAPNVTVEAPMVNVEPPTVNVAAPMVTVEAPTVNVENRIALEQKPVVARKGRDGTITLTPQD